MGYSLGVTEECSHIGCSATSSVGHDMLVVWKELEDTLDNILKGTSIEDHMNPLLGMPGKHLTDVTSLH